jgi:hypothetical protein
MEMTLICCVSLARAKNARARPGSDASCGRGPRVAIGASVPVPRGHSDADAYSRPGPTYGAMNASNLCALPAVAFASDAADASGV